MGVVNGPLFSLGASGTIANTLTYSRWRGVPYVRQRVIPSNPRSTDQTEVRGIFTNLNQIFVNLPTNSMATWEEDSRGRPYTARNAIVSRNLAALQGQADLTALKIIEPRGLAPAPTGVVVTDGGGQLVHVVSDTPPNLDGVAFTQVLGAAIKTFNPDVANPTIFIREQTDVAAAIAFDIDVDTAGTYLVNVAWQWTIAGFVVTSSVFTEMQIVA